MGIFFVWLVMILCSLANGYLYVAFFKPDSFFMMLIPSAFITLILDFHRNYTRRWKKPRDIWENYWFDEYNHFPIFRVTTIIGLTAIFLLWAVPGVHKFWMTTAITATLANAVASWKEFDYTLWKVAVSTTFFLWKIKERKSLFQSKF